MPKELTIVETEDTWSAKKEHRPQRFSDFIGQETAISILRGQESSGKFSRSYLFTGQFGDGKTSLARALAKKINGTKDDKHPNIFTFNGTVETGVDAMREKLASLRYAPICKGKRCIIVEEVHGLSKASASAFLLDLENPPDHVVFMLCTNEEQKLLPTIRSRCKKIELKPLNAENMKTLLMRAAEKEGVFQPVEKYDSLYKSLAHIFQGRNRDALNTLSNLADIARSRKLTNEDVKATVKKILGFEYLDAAKFLALIYKEENPQAFTILKKVTDYVGFSYIVLNLNTWLLQKSTGLEPDFNYAGKTLLANLKNKKVTVPAVLKVQKTLIELRRDITSQSAVEPDALVMYHMVSL